MQDHLLEPLQVVARVETEFIEQSLASFAVDAQRVGLPSRSVQREHELGAATLAQRRDRDERFELGDDRVVLPGAQACVDKVLDGGFAQLGQSRGLGEGPRLMSEFAERVASPASERDCDGELGAFEITGLAARLGRAEVVFELVGVDGRVGECQLVSGRGGDQDRRTCTGGPSRLDDAAQGRHVGLQRGVGARRGTAAPEVVDEALDGDDLALCQQQARQQCTLALASKFGHGPLAYQRERAEYSIFHATSSGWPECSCGPLGVDSRGG